MKITCYSNGEVEYFAILEENKIRLFTGEKLIREIEINSEIDSVVFDGKSYIYVEKDSNTLVGIELKNKCRVSQYMLEKHEKISLLKCLDNGCVVLKGQSKDNKITNIFIYDLSIQKILYMLPFEINKNDEFYDLVVKEDCVNVYGCFRRELLDLDYQDTYLMAYRLKKEQKLELIDKLMVTVIYDDFDECIRATDHSEKGGVNGMRFPLFKYYLYHWLTSEKCMFSTTGNNVCFYSKDFKGLILADIYNGNVSKLIALPEEILQDQKVYKYFYNEHTGVLSIISCVGVEQYKVDDSSSACGNEIEILNRKYNEAYEKGINLQKHLDRFEFTRAFFRAVEASMIKKIDSTIL